MKKDKKKKKGDSEDEEEKIGDESKVIYDEGCFIEILE